MIIISARIESDPDAVAAMSDAIVTMMQASEAEEGCYTYVFSTEIGSPGVLRIFERWENEEALETSARSRV